MEHPSVYITTARSLQPLAYICTLIAATFWTYDYICSLHEEWTFLLRSRLTKVKVLYIVTRYVPFFIVAADLYMNFSGNEDRDQCLILSNIYACLRLISLACSECLFVLRTCALWNNNRIILIAILSTIFAIGIWLTTVATSHVTNSVIPDITGCHRSSGSFSFFMQFIVLLVFQLVLVSLTLVRVVQSWRSAQGPLYAILLKHNIFYYACGLLLSAINILVPKLLDYSISYFVPESLEVLILAMLATRMHLHLWHMNRHANGSEALVCISMSDMSPVN
ncbi:uncharacterized protein F5891DRAFT_649647 [Suillus fuscotomentosus]|uniref:DUF6533 domain-containing protein n=1 Tax=Suillus fuscotomentosus TaxID=1912939 RepID=A0AAD4DXI9_9AGAM|nr:uncharacterized protein F5891DRAFT_649647 [Suillus fuscotomentosus]KAG1895792.1 hypothetical protein F5891DRAFT_649647 [Suillus fuscotomentosus]